VREAELQHNSMIMKSAGITESMHSAACPGRAPVWRDLHEFEIYGMGLEPRNAAT
jgi:hypothetical protein